MLGGNSSTLHRINRRVNETKEDTKPGGSEGRSEGSQEGMVRGVGSSKEGTLKCKTEEITQLKLRKRQKLYYLRDVVAH